MKYWENPNYIAMKENMKRNLAERVPIWDSERQKEPNYFVEILKELGAGDLFIWSKWHRK